MHLERNTLRVEGLTGQELDNIAKLLGRCGYSLGIDDYVERPPIFTSQEVTEAIMETGETKLIATCAWNGLCRAWQSGRIERLGRLRNEELWNGFDVSMMAIGWSGGPNSSSPNAVVQSTFDPAVEWLAEHGDKTRHITDLTERRIKALRGASQLLTASAEISEDLQGA